MKYFLENMVPYCTVSEGDTVIQVGAAAELISVGLSQPLIYSALVGPTGHVYVIEPDPINLNGLVNYLAVNKVENITLIPKAAWDKTGQQRFTFYIGRGKSGANVATEFAKPHPNPKYQSVIVQERETEVDSLDNLIKEHRVSKVNHVNVTVNGTEYRVLRGMADSIDSIDSVSFVYQGEKRVNSPILEYLEGMGFDILIRHAPVSLSDAQFLVGLATRNMEGFVSELFDNGYEAKFAWSPQDRRIQVIRAPKK